MNFLAFREQIYDWTLDNDQNLFNQVNQLTQYIFQTEKNINQSIAITRSSLNESSTILNNNFNHYLRLSENKFTENKIGEPKKSADQDIKKEQTVIEPKPKMQIYKEALNISLKNLQIKQEQKQADNVSLSQLSLSQAIFKNARLPPYFGSKQFRAQKFLSLFFDEDLGSQTLSKKEIQSLSNQPLSTPSQSAGVSSITNNVAAQGYLPPPPSLETLNLGNNGYYGGMNPSLPPPPGLTLPPPPSLTLPPLPPLSIPPPPSLTIPQLPPPPSLPPPPGMPYNAPNRQSMVQIDEKDENKDLLLSIMASTKNNNQQTSQNSRDSFISQTQQSEPIIEKPKPAPNRPMTLQQQLALKLKFGKDYKPPAIVIQSRPSEPISQVRRQQQVPQQSNNGSNFRQSTKIQDIIGGVSQNAKTASKQQNKQIFEDDDQEQSALFGSGKRKTVAQISNQTSQNTITAAKNQADMMMSRSTFNEDMLFKKKPVFSKQSIIPTKTQQKVIQKPQKKPTKASAIFNQDSDQQDDFTFKKKTTKKAEQKVQQVQQKKVEPQPKKKTVNKLFGGDSDQEEDLFAKKKTTSKKTSQKQIQSPTKNITKSEVKIQKIVTQSPKKNPLAAEKPKKNSLFNDDEQQEFSFKPKVKEIKKQSQNDEKQPKKSSLFKDDDQQDFSFKPKSKTSNKQQPIIPQQTVQQVKKVENENDIQIQKPENKNKLQVVEQIKPKIEQESQQQAKLRKIARMGGQPMMGIAQMMAANVIKRKQPVQQVSEKIQQQIIQQPISRKEDLKSEKLQQQQTVIVSKKPLDPLQQLITQTLNNKKLEEEIKQSEKPKINQISAQNSEKSSEVTLQVRRKKNKPKRNLDEDFDQEQKKPEKLKIPPSIQSKPIETKVQVTEPKQKKVNPLFAPSIQSNDQKQSQIQKIAKMSMAGMPQMGLGPLMMPKGLIITKPSQAKKIQQQALERLKHQQQDRKIRQKQQQQQKQRLREIHQKQEENRIAKQKYDQQLLRIAQQQKRKIEQENLIKKQIQEQKENERRVAQKQAQRQKQIQNQRQKQRLLDEINQKQRQRANQQQQRQRLIAQQQQRIRNQEIIKLQAERQRKANLPILPNFDLSAKSQSSQPIQKNTNSNPLNVPKMPPKVNPLGGGLSKGPLGGSLGGPLGGNTQKSNNLGLNSLSNIPSIPSVKPTTIQKNTGKKSLFDEDQQDTFQSKKSANLPKTSMPPMPSINEKKKGSLFDDDDGDSGFGMKSKQKAVGPTKKKGLFDDDQDEGFGFGKKPQKKIAEPISLPIEEPIKRIPEVPKIQQQVKLPQNPIQKSSNAKKLFGGSDSEQQSGFGKKKVEPVKQTPSIQATTNNFGQKQVKSNPKIQKQVVSKKGLFAGSSDEDVKPVAKQTKNVPPKQIKSKKGLFGGSSDEDDDVFKKKNTNKIQAPKQNNIPQSSPLIPTLKSENISTSPLIPTKKVQSLLPNQTPKLTNPLMGSSNGPISSPVPAKSQPLIQNIPAQPKVNPPQQQKKRNIFEESDDDSASSPIIATKHKVVQKPAKKGLISEESQDEAPIKVIPVKQQEPQPTVATKANNNRKLFDESEQDSDEQEIMRKKRMANSKLKKLF